MKKLLTTIAVVLAVIIGYQVFIKPFTRKPPPYLEEAKTRIDELASVRASDVIKTMRTESFGQNPTVIMVYASWCPHCRRLMKELVPLSQDASYQHVDFYFISMDKDLLLMASYMVGNDYFGKFTPYVVKHSSFNNLQELLEKNDIPFNNQIPFTAFIDANGTLTESVNGYIALEALIYKLNTLSQ